MGESFSSTSPLITPIPFSSRVFVKLSKKVRIQYKISVYEGYKGLIDKKLKFCRKETSPSIKGEKKKFTRQQPILDLLQFYHLRLQRLMLLFHCEEQQRRFPFSSPQES